MNIDAQSVATARDLIETINERLEIIRVFAVDVVVAYRMTGASPALRAFAHIRHNLDALGAMLAELDVVHDPAGQASDTGPYGLDATGEVAASDESARLIDRWADTLAAEQAAYAEAESKRDQAGSDQYTH
jgi:hypothetical protein